MPFTNAPADWLATGTEPPASLKNDGWAFNQKPPAPHFNWYFNRTYLALQELQNKAAEADLVIAKTEKGAAGGVATLGDDGKIPADQLNVSGDAASIDVTDAGNYFQANEVEGALQEIGYVLAGTRSSLVTSANNILST